MGNSIWACTISGRSERWPRFPTVSDVHNRRSCDGNYPTPQRTELGIYYASDPTHADLCTIPLPGYREFVGHSNRIGLNGANTLVSFGRELFDMAEQLIGPLVQQTISDPTTKRWSFPHAPSKTHYETLMPKYGIPRERLYLEVFPRFGNVVSASIPMGISLALEQGVLERGDDIAFVPVSAGMVASVVQTVF